jgi:general secretion pathway protein F
VPTFRYRAVTVAGETVSGDLEASDQAAAVARVQAMGHYPVAAEEASAVSLAGLLTRDLLGDRVRPGELRLVTRELATLLRASLSLERSLEVLSGGTASRGSRKLMASVLEHIREGDSFADALQRHEGVFPPVYVGMVRAGEAGGALEAAVSRLADFLDRAHRMRETVKSALVYPVLLIVLSVVSVAILLGVVLPQFRPLFEGAGKTLPTGARALLAIGDGVAAYWWLGLGAAIGFGVLARHLLRRPAARLAWHKQVLRLPMLGPLAAKIELARFSRTLGTLLGNGVTLMTAMSVSVRTVSNMVVAHAIDAVAGEARAGKGLADPLARSGVFPDLAVHLIRVGEESDQLKDMLIKVAEIYEEEVGRTVERLMALLVPTLTVTIGGVVAAIIMTILSAILSVYDLAV